MKNKDNKDLSELYKLRDQHKAEKESFFMFEKITLILLFLMMCGLFYYHNEIHKKRVNGLYLQAQLIDMPIKIKTLFEEKGESNFEKISSNYIYENNPFHYNLVKDKYGSIVNTHGGLINFEPIYENTAFLLSYSNLDKESCVNVLLKSKSSWDGWAVSNTKTLRNINTLSVYENNNILNKINNSCMMFKEDFITIHLYSK